MPLELAVALAVVATLMLVAISIRLHPYLWRFVRRARRDRLAAPRPSEPRNLLEGRYRLGHSLGRGMNAITYCVEDAEAPSRPLVAKMLLTPEEEPRISDESFRRHSERFRREMRNLEILSGSDYIVRVYKSYPLALRPFFVMERCEESLAQRLPGVPLEMEEILDILIDVCRGLSCCHRKNILHRDLKPANILRREREWVLTDFGMSLLGNERTLVSVPESLPGTIPYTAPEVMYYDAAEIGPPADIFSLGVTLKEMLTGRNSWHGAPSTLLEHRFGETKRREVACFDRLIGQMMSLQPEDRPQTVADVRKLLINAFIAVNETRRRAGGKRREGQVLEVERLDSQLGRE